MRQVLRKSLLLRALSITAAADGQWVQSQVCCGGRLCNRRPSCSHSSSRCRTKPSYFCGAGAGDPYIQTDRGVEIRCFGVGGFWIRASEE